MVTRTSKTVIGIFGKEAKYWCMLLRIVHAMNTLLLLSFHSRFCRLVSSYLPFRICRAAAFAEASRSSALLVDQIRHGFMASSVLCSGTLLLWTSVQCVGVLVFLTFQIQYFQPQGIPMRLETLQDAVQEAERFLERARTLQELVKENPQWGMSAQRSASGAVRRASMDLTRALSNLRRSEG